MTSKRKHKKRDKKLLGKCWMLDCEPNIKHYSRAYKHSHKYYAKCQKRYDGFFSLIKVDPHIFLQHPKVAYVIDKKDLVNPNGLFSISIKDYLGKQEI